MFYLLSALESYITPTIFRSENSPRLKTERDVSVSAARDKWIGFRRIYIYLFIYLCEGSLEDINK